MGKALIVVAGIVVIVALVGFFALRALRHSTRDHRRVRAERDAAVAALRAIDVKVREYHDWNDPDSILASTVKEIVIEYEKKRMELEKT